MPILDCTEIQNKLIVLNCLSGEDSKAVRELWNISFDHRHAQLIDYDGTQSVEQFARTVCNVAAENGFVSGERCILGFYLDFQHIDADASKRTVFLAAKIKEYSQLNITLCLQFAYLGDGISVDRATLRQLLMTQVEYNIRATTIRNVLCMLSNPPLTKNYGKMWYSSMALMSLLHHSASPDSELPTPPDGNPNNDICFMQYGDFSQEEWDSISRKIEGIKTKLSSSGSEIVKRAWDMLKQKIASAIHEKFITNASNIPIPSILITNNCAFASIFHKKEIEVSVISLIEATERTASKLEDAILLYVESNWCDTKALLDEIMNGEGIGIELKNDERTIRNIICSPRTNVESIFTLANSRFSLEDYQARANKYLEEKRTAAIAAAIKRLQADLLEEYAKLWPSSYEDAKAELTKQLSDAEDQFRRIVKKDALLAAERTDRYLETAFHPIKPGGSSRTLYMYYGSRTDVEKMLTECNSTTQSVHYINQTASNAYAMHFPNLIAMRILSFDCDMSQLEDLLPTVEVL